MTPPAPPLAVTDAEVLRRELALRIGLQNLLLMLASAVFAAFAVLALALPETAWPAAAAQGAAGLGLALQWCHHGIRTKQIKDYLLIIDRHNEGGWERWLPVNRPRTLLGSRWRISTAGVFLGLQLAMIGLAWRVAPAPDGIAVAVAAGLLLASAGFLLTSPRE